ncbi:MAG: FTR1 family protein [Desulfurococcales archaeon]|nr:FTR1 family protein [Desulfurococcales archaeon]
MLGQFVIMLREAFEAALIIAIILAYLRRSGLTAYTKGVWLGVSLSIIVSILIGVAVMLFYGAVWKKELFEAIASYLAVAVLTSVIYWMAIKGNQMKAYVEERVSRAASSLALAAVTFVIVFREGVETVLFLTPFMTSNPVDTIIGLILGLASALGLAYAMYAMGVRIDLRKFFYYSSLILVLVASGLLGYGTHEFIEYLEDEGVDLGWLAEEAYDLGIPEDSIWSHKGAIGSLFAVLTGYSTSMEWGRILVQLPYLIVASIAVTRIYGRSAG